MDNSPLDFNQAKILVVDDTTANVDLLRRVLQLEGYKVSFADHGAKALTLAERGLPDLILLDVMMPEMDGLETCRRLKANPLTRDIPVIFITAKNDVEDVVIGFQVGAVDYIGKPFQREEVCLRVRTHLQTRLLIRQRENLLRTQHETEQRFRLLVKCVLDELHDGGEAYQGFAENLAQRIIKYDLDGMLALLEQLEKPHS